MGLSDARGTTVTGEGSDPATVAKPAPGHDAMVSAIGPSGRRGPRADWRRGPALLQGSRTSGVHRSAGVGGSGALLLPEGRRTSETRDFPLPWRPIAEAYDRALPLYRAEGDGVEGTVNTPAAGVDEGPRTGRFRGGRDEILTGDDGAGRISVPDRAVAVVDELETRARPRSRIPVAY